MSQNDLGEKKKIFSYSEAVALLPEVKRLTEDAYRRVEAIKARPEREAASEAAQQAIDRIVSEWAYEIVERGIDVKGLWLIDFDNGSGYYCWRHPEPGLHFYHSYEEGFGGRVPIQ
jgi:hypothetical protein